MAGGGNTRANAFFKQVWLTLDSSACLCGRFEIKIAYSSRFCVFRARAYTRCAQRGYADHLTDSARSKYTSKCAELYKAHLDGYCATNRVSLLNTIQHAFEAVEYDACAHALDFAPMLV
jgi:hypothetical protein